MKNFKRNMSKALASASTVAAMGAMTMTQVFADDPAGVDASPTSSDAIQGIVNGLCFVAKIVGVGLAAYGCYEIVISFLQNQPESKIKGITMVACGAAMFFLDTIINSVIGVQAG